MTPSAGRSRSAPALLAAVTIALLAGGGRLPAAEPPARPNILFILADTLRRDYLGCYGFQGEVSPNLDRLAGESVRFDRAVAQAPWTKPSIASLFTSLHTETHRVIDHDHTFLRTVAKDRKTDALPQEAITLAEVLLDGGYGTAAWTANGWISENLGFSQGFEEFQGTPGDEENILDGDNIWRPAWEWLESYEEDRPFFLYLHFMDPHGPWRWNPEEWRALKESPSLGDRRPATSTETTQVSHVLRLLVKDDRDKLTRVSDYRALYAAGVRVFDRRLGALLDRLRRSPFWENTLIVFTSDHGEELLDHGRTGHGQNLHRHQTSVPLLVRLPGGAAGGRVLKRTVSLIDLMPTLLSAAGLRKPKGLQGEDLWNLIEGRERDEGEHYAFAGAVKRFHRRFSVENERYRLLMDYPAGRNPLLYDIVEDPAELKDLALEKPDLLRRLAAVLEEKMKALQSGETLLEQEGTLTPDQLEKLKALGYVE